MKAPLPHTKGGRVIADWVTDTLQAAIISGHFESGEKLDQDLISKELEVNYQHYYASGNSENTREHGANDCSGTLSPAAYLLNSTSIDISDQTCEEYGLGCYSTVESGAVDDLDATCPVGEFCGAAGTETFELAAPANLRIIQ